MSDHVGKAVHAICFECGFPVRDADVQRRGHSAVLVDGQDNPITYLAAERLAAFHKAVAEGRCACEFSFVRGR